MTKQQELDILSEAINKLGADSYLGPWLSNVRAEVASLIRNDHFPALSIAETVHAAHSAACALRREAQVQAEHIRNEAAKLKSETIAECNAIRERLADAIHQAEKAIN